jgi:hypothetical protein
MSGRLPAMMLLALICTGASAAEEDGLPAGLESSVSRGLAFLAGQQDGDGSFDGGGTSKVAATSRALLAYLGAGNAPDSGRYGLVVRHSLDWLISVQTPDGYFGESRQSGMRGHALATLALAEAYGIDANPDSRLRIHLALEKAVTVIDVSQGVAKVNPAFVGGWNADRNAADSSLSVTRMQLLALYGCQQIGIPSPPRTLKAAGEFVQRCYDTQAGGFGAAPGKPPQVPSTATGIECLRLLNLSSQHAPELDSATKFLAGRPIDANTPIGYPSINLVAFCAYEIGGDAWSKTGVGLIERLRRSQEKDGGWPQAPDVASGAKPPNRTASTAAALQTLTIPYQLLPIYQR